MKKLIITVLVGTLAWAGSENFMIKPSEYSVDETVKRFTQVAKKKGFTIFKVINHTAGAKKVGLTMPQAKVIIFGNPKGGTLLMQKDILSAIDLPLKVLVFKDKKGVKLAYKKPSFFAKEYDLKGHKVLKKVSNGQRLRIYYVTQYDIRPPQIALVMNKPKLLHFTYRRYLTNKLREAFDFNGTPVLFKAKTRGSSDDDEA